MITVEDKIRTFSKYVYDKEVKKSNELLEEIENKNREMIEAKQQDIQLKCSVLSEKMNKKIEMECQKIISQAKMQARNKTLQVKKKVLDNFVNEVKSSLIKFTESQEYETYVEKVLIESKNMLTSGDAKIYLVEKDIQKFENDIKNKYETVEILKMADDNIGGLIIESLSTKERVDFTIKRKVNDWKSEIGIRLYEALEK